MKNNKLLWIVGLIIVGLIFVKYSNLFSINPCDNPNPLIDNGYISKYSPNSIQSISASIRVRGDDKHQMNGYFKFKLSQDLIDYVKSGNKLSSASIEVYPTYISNSETIRIYTASSSWSENNITWNNAPNKIELLGSYAIYTTSKNRVQTFPLTAEAIENRIKAGDTELTIMFDGGTSGNEVRFSSKQSGGTYYSCPSGNSMSEQSAQLNINYNTITSCVPNWKCESWKQCKNEVQTRKCYDRNICNNNLNKPETSRSCSKNTPTQTTKITYISPITISTELSNVISPATKSLGVSKRISYNFGRMNPPVSMDNSVSYKTSQPFTQTTSIKLADYPLGYEMAKIQINIKVITCKSFPVYIYWYDGTRLIGKGTFTVNPINSLCVSTSSINAVIGHTGQGPCGDGKQYVDYLGKDTKYAGGCFNLIAQDEGGGTGFISKEIEHTGDYSVVVDTLGTIKTIKFKVI